MTLTTVKAAPVRLNERLLLALARARAQGQSAYKIAAQAGVHPSDLSRWMHGRRSPSAAQAESVARVLGCKTADIFPIDERRPGAESEASRKTDAGGQNAGYRSD
jgi:transcriptional regulator with XRE-family HTH domain